MTARNGKIARLPRFVRKELNERLECSEPGPQLLDWLNALPQAREIVRDEFDGVPISKQNLSQWRRGGFQEWLARKELWAEARKISRTRTGKNQSNLRGQRIPLSARCKAFKYNNLQNNQSSGRSDLSQAQSSNGVSWQDENEDF